MPFNEQGEWVTLNPYDEYRSKVIRSKEQPGAGGWLWNSELRKRLHDEATLYVMEQEGIADTAENFARIRARITREIEEDYDVSERNGFVKTEVNTDLPQQDSCYKRSGD